MKRSADRFHGEWRASKSLKFTVEAFLDDYYNMFRMLHVICADACGHVVRSEACPASPPRPNFSVLRHWTFDNVACNGIPKDPRDRHAHADRHTATGLTEDE